MRKEIQNDPGSDAELFAQQKSPRELIQALPVDHQDQLVDSPILQKAPNLLSAEDTDQLQPPKTVALDRLCKFIGGRPIADDCHMADIEWPVFGYFHQNETIRNKKDIVDGQREYQDDTIGPVRAQKQNQSGQNDPRPADCFREAPYLAERRQSGLGIHAEQRKQHSPGWK